LSHSHSHLNAEIEVFKEGEHPLEGVKDFTEFPPPEPISEGQETSKLVSLIGKYRTRCLLSRNWQLRNAVLYKASMLLPDIADDPGIETAAPGLCSMLARAVDDRGPKVFLTSLILLDDCLAKFDEVKMTAKQVHPLIENIVLTLISRLADSNRGVGEAAEMTLGGMLGHHLCVGPHFIGSHAVKQMNKKDLRAPKVSRLM